MLDKVLGGLVGLVALLFALGFVLPDRAYVEREIIIKAPAEEVYGHISDLNAWDGWSPWTKIQQREKRAASGFNQHATSQLAGSALGVSAEEIIAVAPPGHVVARLGRGSMGEANAAFKLIPLSDGSTKVVWTYHANTREGVPVHLQPISTYLGYIAEPMLGPSYEEGLSNLKRIAEAG